MATPSGKKRLNITLDSELFLKLQEFADSERRSLSSVIEIALERLFLESPLSEKKRKALETHTVHGKAHDGT